MQTLDNRANLINKNAIVIGGGDGIGKAVVLALAQTGIHVAFCDIAEMELLATESEVRALGRRALGQIADANRSGSVVSVLRGCGSFFQ